MKAVRLTTIFPDGNKTVKVFDVPGKIEKLGGTGLNGQAIRQLKISGRCEVEMETGRILIYEVVK